MPYTADDSAEFAAMCRARKLYGDDEPVNIFYLDEDPARCAQAHVDRHVVKMVLETAQLLSTAWHVAEPDAVVKDLFFADLPGDAPPGECPAYPQIRLGAKGGRIYKKTHEHHPCAEWARTSAANYSWLHQLGLELCKEYKHRYKKDHATAEVLHTLRKVPKLPRGQMNEPPCAMPEELKLLDAEGYYATVESYRNYYVAVKSPMFKWTNRRPPSWLRQTPDGAWSVR